MYTQKKIKKQESWKKIIKFEIKIYEYERKEIKK